MDTPNVCPFLQIPTELRLLIYSFALLDTPVITIGTAELVGSHADVVHRLYGNHRNPFPGIPTNHEPVIEPTYKPSLLSLTNPATIPLPPAIPCPLEKDEAYSTLQHSPHLTLLLVNKQIHGELTSHFKLQKNRRTSLFVSYPYGLHVLKTLTPGLVRQARSLHLAGVYTSKSFNATRGACVSVSPGSSPPTSSSSSSATYLDPFAQTHNGNLIPDSAASLGTLISSLFGPKPTHRIQKLDLRVYYPGPDSYSTVWGDDNSPTVIALRSIYAGEIGIEVWRGQKGTGVCLTATKPLLDADADDGRESSAGRKESLKKRVVSTVWRRLEEGRRGEPRCGSWVLDPKWPFWEEGYEMSEGPRGDVIISTGL